MMESPELSDLAIPAAIAAIDYVISKTPLKANSTVEIILKVLQFGAGLIFKKKGSMNIKFIFILPVLAMLGFSGCSSEQRQEAKETTARGLGEGLSSLLQGDSGLLCEKPILECEKPEMAKEYIVQKTCDALGAECFAGTSQKFMKSTKKGFLARFACKAAIKVVLPALMPSSQLPSFLKYDAGCKASCLDQLTGDYAPKICENL